MKNKRILSFLLILLSLLTCFGCKNATAQTTVGGDTPASAEATVLPTEETPEYATFNDLLDDPAVTREQSAYDGKGHYVCVYEKNGIYYRAIALSVSEKTMDALFELEWDAPDREKQERELLGPIVINRIENLSEQIPPQTELDKLIGKTGKELLDDGWMTSGCYDLEDMVFSMDKGMFSYNVSFESNGVKPDNTDDFMDREAIQPLIVKSISYAGIGFATDLE